MRHTCARGQALTESILVIPLFLFFLFGVLQIGQLGVALLMTNYAASSIARKTVNEQSLSSSTALIDLSPYYKKKADELMIGGMSLDTGHGLEGCVYREDPQIPTADLTVIVRSKMKAWPFFADILNRAWQGKYEVQSLSCPGLVNSGGFGPFNFSADAPYYFYVTGRAKIRLNYVQ